VGWRVEVGVNISPTRATPAADGNDLGHTVLVETRAPNHSNTTHHGSVAQNNEENIGLNKTHDTLYSATRHTPAYSK
jgi:hypothetical protein